MKFVEFTRKSLTIKDLSLLIISGDEYFLKEQALTEVKKRFLSEGGTAQGLIRFNSRDTRDNARIAGLEDESRENAKGPTVLFYDILNEVRTASMFGKYKLVIVEDADNIIAKYQDKLSEYVKNSKTSNSLVLNVQSIDKRTKLAKLMDNKHGILIECNKPYDRPAPWETSKPEYDSELTRWIVMHAKRYNKVVDMKTAFSLFEKVGNNLAIIDKQVEVLSVYTGDRKEITVADIKSLLGSSHREKIYSLLDAVSMKQTASAIKIADNIFNIGIENERKNITYDKKTIAIAIISSLHKRLKELWKTTRVLDNNGSKEDILKKTSVKRPFIDKFIKQARNYTEEEMPEKWKHMLEADLLCKTSRLSPTYIVEKLIIKLCA